MRDVLRDEGQANMGVKAPQHLAVLELISGVELTWQNQTYEQLLFVQWKEASSRKGLR